jgi:hypothetical protein
MKGEISSLFCADIPYNQRGLELGIILSIENDEETISFFNETYFCVMEYPFLEEGRWQKTVNFLNLMTENLLKYYIVLSATFANTLVFEVAWKAVYRYVLLSQKVFLKRSGEARITIQNHILETIIYSLSNLTQQNNNAVTMILNNIQYQFRLRYCKLKDSNVKTLYGEARSYIILKNSRSGGACNSARYN